MEKATNREDAKYAKEEGKKSFFFGIFASSRFVN
jgi:hypothetical protein